MEEVKFGLKENWKQFSLLVVINAFVGGMIGLERTVLPALAEQEFGISSKAAIFSFIVAFGITKAICNYFTGKLANIIGRKNLLVIGWVFAIPIPFILIFANSWDWIIFANILLGINQGLTWSMAVVMKIDLVGSKKRGLAVGINEFAGYVSVGIVAFLTGYIASHYGLRPYPFYLGIAFSVLGLILSLVFVKDTNDHVKNESIDSNIPLLSNIFIDTTFRHKSLSGITQAGLVNNLNDGMIWGLLPMLLLSLQFTPTQIGILAAVYPTVWGLSQLFTGKLSDIYSKKWLLFFGMVIQSLAIFALVFAIQFWHFAAIGVLLGFGTALVYPTFINAISDFTHPSQRAESLGTFRFWRDLGYAIGAITTGLLADIFGVNFSIAFIAILTALSALVVVFRIKDV
ncbi:MFS transporter [Lacihabitans sp. CS3-21]|uniref:MFS transporter n=1 Tax=Lacihabitans sp. CS3-21 TaxID=2487332 RepID=UPI0020CDAD85|nr:MFS transporter [Lacihabitans sp. CS3-21]MCP9747049.1 MFS transporter [Lacihabitans sp. CS3-21]